MPFLSPDERVPLAMPLSHSQLPQGPFVVGVFVGIFLYGFSVHQAYRYIRSFPTDAAYIRLLVIVVMILETVHALANMHTLFHYLISSYSEPNNLQHLVWSLSILPAISGLVVVTSQIFFIRRVALIGPRQRVMARVVAVTLVAELGFALAATAITFTNEGAGKTAQTVTVLSGAALVIAAIADTTMTVALVQAFRAHRAMEPPASESPFDVVQLYVINSGIATGVFNLVSFIVAATLPPGNLLFSVFNIISVRLYANSLLAVYVPTFVLPSTTIVAKLTTDWNRCVASRLNSRELRGMEFFLSASFASVTLEGAQFADKSALWNVPRASVRPPPRVAASQRGDKLEFTNPWGTDEKGGYGGFR
ncbi:hypothetical protein GSI_05433 [Ganoderma sinense ZZ0214-1]|uniref:DUF6534 domain-containing protein n=1 Tax=Ganoderma sinense ZZ0214-1 TaxID=1077348 RepID=A0A2G8SF26_9APHY|nr:hypothetical protein GSI_05433 [Ganoderma sinense ZZ0214-1]